MTIFITGATGFIGRHVVPALQADGHQLTLCLRNISKGQQKFPNCTLVKGDFSKDHHPEDWLPRLQDCDAVINLVGIISEDKGQTFENLHSKAPIALFQAAQQAGISQIIQISALGADQRAETAYHNSKKSADDFLRSLDLNAVILRPSLIYGEDAQSWQLFGALAALPIIGLVGGGKQVLQPIHIDDLTTAIVSAIKNPPQETITLDAVGATPISFRKLLKNLRKPINPHPALTFPIPVALAKGLAQLASLSGAKMINADTIKMLQRGSHANVAPFARQFSFSPRILTFGATSKAEKLLTRTYFIPPVLRLSIALTWLWTAVVSAYLYPVADSLALLAKTGLTGNIALFALYGSVLLDLMLGIAVLLKFKPRLTTLFQLGLMAAYSLILTIFIPELWLHPFGPLLKNFPMVAAILALQAMETAND